MPAESYRDRTGRDPVYGAALKVSTSRTEGSVLLELGAMRNFGSLSTDAWAALTPAEARELADNLDRAAADADRRAGQAA